MNTATQLKALIRNVSKNKKVNAQILLRSYMLERLLERISISKYKKKFILKGGMLIASMVGIDTRSTMDMDATIIGTFVSRETIEEMFNTILAVNINDGISITINSIDNIYDEADYTGFRISLNTNFDGIKQTLKIDITTGDIITPHEIGYKYSLMFEDRFVEVMAYNIETVLSEKVETIISRGTTNTRMRDFYDIYILTKLQRDIINKKVLVKSFEATAVKRGTIKYFDDIELIISEVLTSGIMQNLWKRYQNKNNYANDISWREVISAVEDILNISDVSSW